MRVLVVTNMWPRPERPERGVFISREVERLRQSGIGVEVMTIDGYKTRLNYLRAAKAIFSANFQRPGHDLIHANTGHCGLLSCLQFRLPVVLTYWGYDLDGTVETRETPRTRFERLIFRYLSLLVAGTVAQSERGRARIPRFGRRRNIVLPSGIDRQLFSPMPRAEARRRLGWDEEEPVVLFGANPARPIKRFGLAEAAVACAQEQIPAVKLIAAAGVPAEEMPVWMNAADALLLTSKTEGSPNVVKEAMACNLPVVSVDVGDVPDIVGDTRHCHVCAASPRSLADGLVEVISALPGRSNGRERTEYLDSRESNRRLLAHYRRSVLRGPGPLGFLRRKGGDDGAEDAPAAARPAKEVAGSS